MIRTIIFDLGGVVITLDQQQAIRRFQKLGLADAEQRLDAYTQDGIFGDLERGSISAEQFRQGLSLLTGHEVSNAQCRHAWLGYCGELPKRNLDALQQLRRQGYRVVLLSNTNPFMMSWAMSDEFDGCGHSLAYYLDACYLSYQMGVLKPDHDFFLRVLDAEKVAPGETLFVDDGPRNVSAAAALGIHTFCPVNGADWTQELYNYLH